LAAERKGAATAFREWCWRTAGHHARKQIGLLATFSGEPIFWKGPLLTASGKSGGTETRRAIRLRRGRVRDEPKKSNRRGLDAYNTAAQGDQQSSSTVLPQADRAEPATSSGAPS